MKTVDELMLQAWADWHSGLFKDEDDYIPSPNPSFKAGFYAGLVAEHEAYTRSLRMIDSLKERIAEMEKVK